MNTSNCYITLGLNSVTQRSPTPFSKKTLFGKKKSDEWHKQIDSTAGTLRPADQRFPWSFISKHTDYYLKKKGKLAQTDIDIRLALMIEGHEARDVAVAACAHVMSPQAIRALLNIELNVAPATFYGLEMYLQCIIAANYCNSKTFTDLEAQWATHLLPYATHGNDTAGRYLQGFCALLRVTDVPNMSILPDFSILASRAFKYFALQLEDLKLRCAWVNAHSTTAWMASLTNNSPATTPPGHLLPEHILDSQFPIWRIWALWKPNLERIALLDELDSEKRAILPDMLALEGPDFISGRHATLREGLIAQYRAERPFVRFRSLIVHVPSYTKDELREILDRTSLALETALRRDYKAFRLFVKLTISRPITDEALLLLQAVSKIPETPLYSISEVVYEVYTAQGNIGGRHISCLGHLIPTLDDNRSGDLRRILFCPWLIKGLEQCLRDCQLAVRTHIEKGLTWEHLALEVHAFCFSLKGSQSCFPHLDSRIRAQLDVLPSVTDMDNALDIYRAAGGHNTRVEGFRNIVKDSVEAFCMNQLIQCEKITRDLRRTMDILLQVWRHTKSTDYRTLAVAIANNLDEIETRCSCLGEITALSNQFASDLLDIMQNFEECEQNCIKLTRILANRDYTDAVECWRSILYMLLDKQSDTIIDYTLNHFKVWEWFQWILDLSTIFPDLIINSKSSAPTPLRENLHLWVQKLSEYMPCITRLEEKAEGNKQATSCILKGGDGIWEDYLLNIVKSLTAADGWPAEGLMQRVAGRLSGKGGNANEISCCLRALLELSEEGLSFCQRLWDSNQDKSIPIAVQEVIVSGLLEDDDIQESDQAAIRILSSFMNLEIYEGEKYIPRNNLLEARKYYDEEEAEIIKEANRLEEIQKALKARDPFGTTLLLDQLGIQDTDPLDDEIEALPLDVIDAVEKHGKNEIEISFPLNQFTDLERAALGLKTAKTLLVRLFIDYTGSMPPAFCVHLDSDPNFQELTIEHTPWVCFQGSKEPESQYCRGWATPFTWQLNRILHRFLITNGVSIANLHRYIKARMVDLAYSCIVCDSDHNSKTARLRRLMPCHSFSCMRIFNSLPIDVRIPEIRFDPFAVDMLLTGVYAAAMSGRTELLPCCPIRTTQAVIAILNSLPFLSVLQTCTNLSQTLSNAHKDAEQLLTWACTQYRGLIASASGLCRIPGLAAGTHQFVLANANPELESNFAARISKELRNNSPPTRVLFHGTSLDRLPSILAQGLLVKSGTNLQRTGAAHGRGIYLAVDPATSFSYSPSAVSWRNSGLNNMRMLLGCEVVGNINSPTPGIHVIRDEKSVMVRYVFFFTATAHAPNTNHIVTPMLSAMTALRGGSV
ncbi:hypothetical protein CC78DRAFT_331302 [Lojkania enalia]|uniref:Poly [ADP-ribose] polymerase n=1 Tax=Lojkania enalia TaxID=147567 RepID=A0A9P4KHM8_9PLEO|nr:hypothetical protein CC78DRAFT_331302 [Didymosphaeria enalia]